MKGFVLSLCASLAIGLTGTASTADAGGGHHHHNYRYPRYRPVYPVVGYPNQFFFNPYGGYYFPQPLPPVIFYNRYCGAFQIDDATIGCRICPAAFSLRFAATAKSCFAPSGHLP